MVVCLSESTVMNLQLSADLQCRNLFYIRKSHTGASQKVQLTQCPYISITSPVLTFFLV